jgi:hypothetical protein
MPPPLAGADVAGGARQVPSAGRRVMLTLWPAFAMAGLLEMLVFAVVDPGTLHGAGDAPLGWSPQAVYSVAFLVFWAVISVAGWMTQVLQRTMYDD